MISYHTLWPLFEVSLECITSWICVWNSLSTRHFALRNVVYDAVIRSKLFYLLFFVSRLARLFLEHASEKVDNFGAAISNSLPTNLSKRPSESLNFWLRQFLIYTHYGIHSERESTAPGFYGRVQTFVRHKVSIEWIFVKSCYLSVILISCREYQQGSNIITSHEPHQMTHRRLGMNSWVLESFL